MTTTTPTDSVLSKTTQRDNSKFIRKYKLLITIVSLLFLLIFCCMAYYVTFLKREAPCCSTATCMSAPNSKGCEDCRNNGIEGSQCRKCDNLWRDFAGGLTLKADDQRIFIEYCTDNKSENFQICKEYPNSEGCLSCVMGGESAETCDYCENNNTSSDTLDFQRKCRFSTQEFRNYLDYSTYINGNLQQMDPLVVVLEDMYKTEYTFESYYIKDLATITESKENIGFTVTYTLNDYYMDIFVENKVSSTTNNEPIYYSYGSDINDDVETKYLGKLKKVVYSDIYFFTDSYLTEECQTIPNIEKPGTFLASPCGNGLIKSTEVKDNTDSAISGLSISCNAHSGQAVIEHTSESSSICFEFVNNLLVKSRNFE